MKEIDDKKLQELLEKGIAGRKSGLTPEEGEALEVYSMLFEALGDELRAELPRDFSLKVVAKVRSRKERVAEIRFYIIVAFCCLFVGITGVAALMRFGGGELVVSYISRYGTILVLGTVLLLLIQYLDQKLVRHASLKER
jgi:hypothetical protein